MDILEKELTPEERKLIPLDNMVNPLQLGKSILEDISKLNWNNGSTARANRIVQGIQRVARIGDVVIQHSPEVTALVWAGIRVLLQVILIIAYLFIQAASNRSPSVCYHGYSHPRHPGISD